MERDRPFKEQYRDEYNRILLRGMRERVREGNFKPWPDLVNVKVYQHALEQHYGSLGVLAGKKFLDVGAGFGSKLHEFLKRQRVKITNIDIAPESIEFLNKHLREPGFVADIFKMEQAVEEKAYDGVIAVNLFNYIAAQDREDLRDCFKQVHRALNDRGSFFQSQSGFIAKQISRDEQRVAAEEAGFGDIQLLKLMKVKGKPEPTYIEPLAFIARKVEINEIILPQS